MPHSLLKLWKKKGGALEELLVDGNPLIQPSCPAAFVKGQRAMNDSAGSQKKKPIATILVPYLYGFLDGFRAFENG